MAGDRIVLAASGARELKPEEAPQLFNVVQEIAIAANIPMPRVHIINDTAPNAFATGRDPKHASIAITSGLLEKLTREELQGVIAHELSHVRNLDIRLSLIVGVLVGSIALLADFFLRFTFWGGTGRRSRDRDGGGGGLQIVFIVLAFALAILAPIAARRATRGQPAARVPRGCVSGRADAQPLRVGRRAGQDRDRPGGARSRQPSDEHLFFANPIKKFEKRSSGLFSTHPPITDRINRLRELSGEQPSSL